MQQLLKLYAPVTIEGILENVLIMDADLVWMRDVSMFGVRKDKAGRSREVPLYSTGVDFHAPYFEHMNRLLPSMNRTMRLKSGVIHHMILNRAVLQQLFMQVQARHRRSFWAVFVAKGFEVASPCSEYEIYFNFLLTNFPERMGFRQLEYENAGALDFENINSFKMDRRFQHVHYMNFHSYWDKKL